MACSAAASSHRRTPGYPDTASATITSATHAGGALRLTGVDPALGFNLGVALWYALVMVGAFGVVYDLVRLAGKG